MGPLYKQMQSLMGPLNSPMQLEMLLCNKMQSWKGSLYKQMQSLKGPPYYHILYNQMMGPPLYNQMQS
jgi:hypothetical protein